MATSDKLPVFGTDGKPVTYYSDKKNDAYQAQIDREFQRDERLAAQQFEVDMWNQTNAYNEEYYLKYESPEAILRQYKEAGINPNAFKGTSVSSSSPASPLSSHPSSGRGTASSHGMSDVASLMNGIGNIANVTSNAFKNYAEKKNIESLTHLNQQQIDYNDATYDKRVEEASKRVDEITERINKSISSRKVDDSQANLNYATEEQVRAGIPYIAKKNETDIGIMLEQANEIRERVETMKVERQEMKKNGLYSRGLMNSQAAYYNANADLISSDANVAEQTEDERISNAEYETALLKLKSEFSKSLGCPTDVPEFQFLWHLNEEGLLEQYVKDVQGAVVRQTKDIENESSNYYDILKDLWYYITLFGSKGRVRPRM